MELSDRQPSENAHSYALRILLYSIITPELAPGSAVSENELSFLSKPSRTSAWGALTELSKMGPVGIQPQRGSYIAKIDYELIEESRLMCLALESAVLKLVCEGISQEYGTLLKVNLEDEIRYLNAADYIRLLGLDTDLHRLLFLSVGKGRIYEVTHSQMAYFNRLRALSLKSLRPDKIVEDHENILHAIDRRDSELAEMLMTRHPVRYRVEKLEPMKRHPDYLV